MHSGYGRRTQKGKLPLRVVKTLVNDGELGMELDCVSGCVAILRVVASAALAYPSDSTALCGCQQ